jgi:serine/threonine protein kinase
LREFQHEARILSTLNHPSVLAIYDVGEKDGTRYVVSEFLEGQTCAGNWQRGTLAMAHRPKCARDRRKQ